MKGGLPPSPAWVRALTMYLLRGFASNFSVLGSTWMVVEALLPGGWARGLNRAGIGTGRGIYLGFTKRTKCAMLWHTYSPVATHGGQERLTIALVSRFFFVSEHPFEGESGHGLEPFGHVQTRCPWCPQVR